MPEKLNTKSDERSWQIERGCCPPPRQMNGPAGTCGQNVCAMKATFGSTNKIEDSSSSRQSKTTTTTQQRRRLSRVDLSMFVCLFICTLRIRNVISFERSATREQIETQPQSVQIGTTTTTIVITTTISFCGVLSTCSARAGANQPQIAVQRI